MLATDEAACGCSEATLLTVAKSKNGQVMARDKHVDILTRRNSALGCAQLEGLLRREARCAWFSVRPVVSRLHDKTCTRSEMRLIRGVALARCCCGRARPWYYAVTRDSALSVPLATLTDAQQLRARASTPIVCANSASNCLSIDASLAHCRCSGPTCGRPQQRPDVIIRPDAIHSPSGTQHYRKFGSQRASGIWMLIPMVFLA